MRAPLYAASEFPNANPDLHAGWIDPEIFPDVDDSFGDGDVLVVDDLPELAATADEIEVVGEAPREEPESPRESMIRLVAAVASGESIEEREEQEPFDVGAFTSLTLPTLPPIAPDLLATVEEADLDAKRDFDRDRDRDLDLDVAQAADPEPAPAPVAETPSDPFARLIATICASTFDYGATVAADAVIELFSGRPVPPMLLGSAAAGLVAAGLASGGDGESIVLLEKVQRAANEWAKIVRDEGGDLELCGGKTLDEFCADIACAILGDRSKFEPLRRALRGQGVAAYGFVWDAA